MNEMLHDWKKEPLVARCQYLCLLVVAAVELVFLSPAGQQLGITWVAVDYFLEIPAMIFLLLTVARGINRKGRSMMALCFAMLLWTALVQVMRVIRGLDQIKPGEITCFYALALPLAFAMDDGQRQRGLRTLAAVFLLEALRLCVLAGMLYLKVLPESYAASVRWDGARLVELFHPTNCATVLMIGIGICLGICLKTKKAWLRWAMIPAVAIQFLVQILTNGRTGIVLTCLLIGGVVFCAIRKTGWKRAPLALAAGVAVIAVLFLTYRQLSELHQEHIAQMTAQSQQQALENGEQPQEPARQVNSQRSFAKDMVTLNSRTRIWSNSIKVLLQNPKVMICGTDNVQATLASGGGFSPMHTHNSFLELAYTLGIPGLLLALVITVLGMRAAVILLWRNTDMWKSVIALLVVCVFGCGMMEPYLFVAQNNQHYLSIFFLAAVGYLCQWCAEEK